MATLIAMGAGRAIVRATVADDSTPERDVEVLISTGRARDAGPRDRSGPI